MTTINDLFTQSDLIDYTGNRQYPEMLGDTLFPATKINSLKLDVLSRQSRVPVIASVSAFDAESEIGSREAEKTALELALIKRKMQIFPFRMKIPSRQAFAGIIELFRLRHENIHAVTTAPCCGFDHNFCVFDRAVVGSAYLGGQKNFFAGADPAVADLDGPVPVLPKTHSEPLFLTRISCPSVASVNP